MSKRINVMIDEDTWGFLGRVPAGERSRAINEALRAWAMQRRRSREHNYHGTPQTPQVHQATGTWTLPLVLRYAVLG
jgi:hypothetical protein